MRKAMQGIGWTLALATAVLPAGLAAQAVEATDQNDRAAHAFASAVDLGEVQQSILAVQRATNAEVRAYAQQMITDHHNALHTREMLMQTERSGLLPAMNHGNGQDGAHAGHGTTPMPTPEMVAELESVLHEHPMSRPVVEANARNLAVLQGVTGPRFDPTYMDAQISAHRYALQSIDRLLAQEDTLGDDIRGTLEMMRTAVAAHLQTAEQIRARL
jgi:predicted outer membrane protein